MSRDIPQYASIAGELAENLWGRTDFEKYDFAWAQAENWIVDYRGGLFTRPATEFVDILEWTDGDLVKYVPFQFSPDTANTYLIVFTDDKVRFVQDGAYVLEADVAVASLANSTGDDVEFTATGHGFADGDWVKLSGFTTNTSLNTRTGQVTNKTANTFELTDPITSTIIEIASVSTETGTVNRIYTITSPYGQEELGELRATQVADYVRLTHPDYPIKNLIRTAATNWSISNENINITAGTVTGLAEDQKSSSLNGCFVWQVTAVGEDGEEGLPDIVVTTNGPNLTYADGEFIGVDWTAVSGAVSYRVYRSNEVKTSSGQNVTPDSPVGFIAEVTGTQFSDRGITPDFTRRPPIDYNPFAHGRIRYVTVDVAGTGAIYNQTITWPSGGSGAYGYVVAKGVGGNPITGIKVLDGGQDYTGTSVTVATAAGETLTAVLSESSGNNPHCCAIFQQRCVYGGTDNNPLRIFGSYTGFFSNFSYTDIGADNESYEFDLDSEAVAPIRHLIPVRGGLLAFTQIGIWLLYGINNEALSGNNAQADIQTAVGASLVKPVYIDSYVAYVAHNGQEIRLLAYDDYNKVYGGQNISILSNHLFSADDQITSMTFAEVPSKILYATQQSGRMIALTIDNENSVFGATPLYTRGHFHEAVAITEDRTSRVYVAVERKINGNRVMYIERLVRRETFDLLEDSFCLDSGLELTKTAPAGRLVPDSFTGSVTFTTEGGTPFVSGDVGKVIRCGDGKATISAFTSSSEVDATWNRDLTEHFPGDEDTPKEFESGDWTMDSTTTTLGGLWHLEGESIDVLRDGTVQTGITVSSGSITIAAASSRVVAGIPFTCTAKTLPVTVGDLSIEGRRKNISKIALRIYRSIGLKIGTDLTKLKSIADRGQRLWSSDDILRTTIIEEFTRGNWERDAGVFIVQDTPRPAALLNLIRDTDLGDDKDRS